MKTVLLSIFFSLNAFSQQVLKISTGFDRIIPGTSCAYLVSARNALSVQQLLTDTNLSYTTLQHNLLYFDESDYAEDIWLMFSVRNATPEFQSAVLELNNTLIDDVSFYAVRNKTIIDSNICGDEHPFKSRSILFRNPIYLISLSGGDTQTFFFKVNADGRKIHLPLILKSIPTFISDTSSKDIQFGLYYGSLLVLTLISLYLAYTLRDKVFLFFSVYVFFLLVSQLCTSGIAFAYLWPEMPYWNNRSIAISMALTLVSALLFTCSFIDMSTTHPMVRLLLRAVIALNSICAVIALGNTTLLNASMWLLYRLIPIIYGLLITIGGYVLFKKYKSARLFVPGFIFAAISIGGMSLNNINRNADNAFTNSVVMYAVLLKCFLLSIAMFDRLKIFKEEKETAQARVIEQLEELNKYKQEVNVQLEETIARKSRELIEKQNEVKRALISGEEKERKRVAQELHDGMGSLLSTLRLNAEAIDLNDKNLDEKETIAYRNVLEMIDKACTELRAISHNMLPSGIEHFGLEATLQSLIKKINHTGTTLFLLDTAGLESLDNQETELHLYRIVMELVNNIVKHAKAKQASIQLMVNNTEISIIVEDDGIGFNSRNNTTQGTGLLSIQSRVEALNGRFQIDSRIEHGTTATIEIPLPK